MSFLVPCPNCGPRDVNEFGYAGEITRRPEGSPSFEELTAYLYLRDNVAGVQREWWYHRLGCQAWFRADRDTRTNEVLATELASQPRGERGGAPVPDVPAA
jgi:heterotetrameric sarcosine oxidase delta subunit